MKGKKSSRVSIVILNYNNWFDTITCLEIVFQLDHREVSIVLVDNGSDDGSLEHIRKWIKGGLQYKYVYPDVYEFKSFQEVEKPLEFLEYERRELSYEDAQLGDFYEEVFIDKSTHEKQTDPKMYIVDTKENLGYAGGNNVGVRFSLKFLDVEYIMILNNDTAVPPNLARELIKVFSEHENAGLCGPLEYSYEEPVRIQSAGGTFGIYTGRHELQKDPVDKTKIVDWVMGSCMLVKKDLFYKIGFFDERFFLYVEEVDFAYRVKKSGYKTFVCPETCIWHKGGRKGGKSFDALYDFYVMRNRLLFALKHLRFYQLIIFIPNHIKKVFTFSLRDLFAMRKSYFLKRLIAVKEGFMAYKNNIKSYKNMK
jgi:GT2 family glycosyltransferase